MADLLSVEDALEQILSVIKPMPAEAIRVTQGLGHVLAKDVHAPISLPPFPNSSMDGFAVRSGDVAGAGAESPVRLRVVMDIPAGTAPARAITQGEAARIMTGAPMPDGADAVIPVEQTDATWDGGAENPLPDNITIFRSADPGAYVRPAGEDVQSGQLVLAAGTVLRPQDVGILVALGFSELEVIRQPRVVIVSTGDELVEAGEPLAPGQIRDVNSHTISGLVTTYGGIPHRLPIARDTLDDVRHLFRTALAQQPDMIVSSAGVSVGTYDVVRTVIDELGAVQFWRVNVRPGKPLAFGNLGQVPFFGLPGNPVSAMVTFDVFVRPALLKLTGQSDDSHTVNAIVGEDMKSDGRRSYVRVTLTHENGKLTAHPTGTQSSGALMSMVLADGLLIVPEDVAHVSAGTELPVRLLRR